MFKTPHLEQIKKSHLFQEKSNNCGPFCVAVILKAMRNLETNGIDLSEAINKVRWAGIVPIIRRIPDWATFPWGLVDLFRQYKVKSKWRVFCTKDNLEKIISKGEIAIVLIGSWKQKWSHYKILVSLDHQLGYGFIDPGIEGSYVSWQNEVDFMKQWKFLFNTIIEVRF